MPNDKAVSANYKLPIRLGALVFIIGMCTGASVWATSIDYTLKQHTELLKEISTDFKMVVNKVHNNDLRITKIEAKGE